MILHLAIFSVFPQEGRYQIVVTGNVLALLLLPELLHVHVHMGTFELDLHLMVVLVDQEPTDDCLGVLVVFNLIVVPQ